MAKLQAAMTFDEIAEDMHTTRQNVWHAYNSGMRKLRTRYPHSLEYIALLQLDLERMRDQRRGVEG